MVSRRRFLSVAAAPIIAGCSSSAGGQSSSGNTSKTYTTTSEPATKAEFRAAIEARGVTLNSAPGMDPIWISLGQATVLIKHTDNHPRPIKETALAYAETWSVANAVAVTGARNGERYGRTFVYQSDAAAYAAGDISKSEYLGRVMDEFSRIEEQDQANIEGPEVDHDG